MATTSRSPACTSRSPSSAAARTMEASRRSPSTRPKRTWRSPTRCSPSPPPAAPSERGDRHEPHLPAFPHRAAAAGAARHRRHRTGRRERADEIGRALRFRRDLGTRHPQHRLGDDERAHRRARRRGRQGRQDAAVRRRRLGRRVEIRGRRHHVQAGVRQAAGAVDRRDRDRSVEPADRVGRHRRGLDAQFHLDRRRHLQIHRRRRQLHQRRPAEFRAHHQDPGRSARQRHGVCLRAGQAVERLGRPRPVQDRGRRQELEAGAEGREPLHRLRLDQSRPEESRRDLRRAVGFPPQGLDLPLRRRLADRTVASTASSASGPFRAADGDKTSPEITEAANRGFPKKPYGRIAVAVAPSDANIVYAFVESTDSALFRSDDGGKTGDKRDKSQMMVWRPFYFANLIVDPHNPDRLFKPDLNLIMSLDGGKSFANVGGGTHGDHHVIWIDPSNTQHVITGDDGGLWQSYDGGNKWWKQNNLPVSQFYHVSVDDADPYHVYGGLQDNACWVGDSEYPGGIGNGRWENVCGGDGFWMFSDPADPAYLYAETQGGEITRVNRLTHEGREIKPQAGYHEKLRWNWNTPMALSPHEKGTLYLGAQFLFRTRDHGQSWERISPDLTTNDPDKQKQEESGGVTVDNSAAETHTTIYSISESPKQAGLIWVGTDDGNLQLTRDGGKSWSNLVKNVHGVPEHSWVSWVQAGNFAAGTAYVAFDRHSFGDMAPYIYKTTDFGKTWTALVTPKETKGLRGYVHVIKEDPVRPDLLYAGTEFGLWISIDGGASFAQFKGGNFPAVAVRDVAVQARDASLVLATHGRGIWIIDDLTPLRALDAKTLASEAAFLPVKPIQQRIDGIGGWPEGDAAFSGPNPKNGADIAYYQKSRHLFGKLKIEVLDAKGNLVDTIPASVRRGINHVYWSMRAKPPRVPPAAQVAFNSTQGPLVPPGTYTVRMTKGKDVYQTRLEVGLDRRAAYTAADREAQYAALLRVRDLFGEMSDLVHKINAVRTQADATAAKLGEHDALRQELAELSGQADAIRRKIVATKEGGAITGEERLREYADQLYGAIASYGGRPGEYQLARIDVLKRETDDVAGEFARFEQTDLAKANAALKAAGRDAIQVPAGAPPDAAGAGAHQNGEAFRLPFERD